LTAFQEQLDALESRNIAFIAASVDPLADAQETVNSLGLTFSVGYGLDYLAVAGATGAFYEVRREILHATAFILAQVGTVKTSVYASGPVGRLTVEDCWRVIEFYRK
jgi:peroxiredoxin